MTREAVLAGLALGPTRQTMRGADRAWGRYGPASSHGPASCDGPASDGPASDGPAFMAPPLRIEHGRALARAADVGIGPGNDLRPVGHGARQADPVQQLVLPGDHYVRSSGPPARLLPRL